jgi:hypothetical protein
MMPLLFWLRFVTGMGNGVVTGSSPLIHVFNFCKEVTGLTRHRALQGLKATGAIIETRLLNRYPYNPERKFDLNLLPEDTSFYERFRQKSNKFFQRNTKIEAENEKR